MTELQRDETHHPPGPWTLARRGAAIAIIGAVAVLVVRSHYYDGWKTCETTTTTAPGAAPRIERSCAPYAIADTIPLLLLALVFIWPDLSEVELFGIGKIKRRLDRQAQGQDQLLRGQQRLEQHVHTLQLSAQVASQHQETNIDLGESLGLSRQLVDLEKRLKGLEAGEPAPERAEEQRPRDTTLQVAWQRLEPYVRFASRLNDPGFLEAIRRALADRRPPDQAEGLLPRDRRLVRDVSQDGSLDLDRLIEWKERYRAQLETLRQAMQPRVDLSDELRGDALAIAEALLSDLRERSLIA
jgi:hypothetical protein